MLELLNLNTSSGTLFVMYSSDNNQDVSRGLKIINDFLAQSQSQCLNKKESAIINGSLRQLSYKDIKQEYQDIKYYTLEYISRNLAYDLWKKLTSIAQSSQLFDNDYRVNKKSLWLFVEQINQSQLENKLEPINIPAAVREGEILRDRFKIEEYLFDRDSGEKQFRGIDLCLGNKPCLIIQRSNQTSRIRRQFERESKSLSLIGEHLQIPELLTYFAEGQHLYLVYEYISGTALTELLTEKPWQELQVKSLLRSLLNVLEFIQQHNLTHRNLNPDNIIQVNNSWVLTDFATVKETNHGDTSLTYSTFAQGMKGYIATEQYMGLTKFASDIYALGMIAIHAITGIHPCELKRVNPHTGCRIWRDQAQVSNHFADIIDRSIAFDFNSRYQSATEMLETLKNLGRCTNMR